jgi:hypothetical protein
MHFDMGVYSDVDVAGVVQNVGHLFWNYGFVCATVHGEGGGINHVGRFEIDETDRYRSCAEGGIDFVLNTPTLVVLEEKKSNMTVLGKSGVISTPLIQKSCNVGVQSYFDSFVESSCRWRVRCCPQMKNMIWYCIFENEHDKNGEHRDGREILISALLPL